MKSSPRLCCLFIVILFFIFHFGVEGCKDEPVTDDAAGSTVSIEVVPESINEMITDEIEIKCTPHDLPQGTKDILFMELGKEGEHPFVALKGPRLELGADMKSNMEAKGHIANNISQSYLQLTIKRPFVDDVNVYCCRMFYQNEFGELKMGHVYADLSIEKNDRAVFIHLLEKVSDLEDAVLEQKNYSKDLENIIKLNSKELVDQVASKINELKKADKNQSSLIQDILDRDSFSSAFSVYGTETVISSGTLLFKNFILNIGNHYDLTTGKFTTPKNGLYVFHLSVLNYGDSDDIGVNIVVNKNAKASLAAVDNDYYDQQSVNTVLSLEEGDVVEPYVFDSGELLKSSEKYTFFNGYLLKLL